MEGSNGHHKRRGNGISHTRGERADGIHTRGERLKGKVAIITGGARGIGAATARVFAENGAKVIVADILDEAGMKTCEEITSITCGGECKYVHCDVSKEEDVAAAVDVAMSNYGCLDIMFNNAGTLGPTGSIAEVKMEKVERVIEVNIKGVVHGIKHAARAMIPAKRGCILCTASSAGVMGGLAPHVYSMTKAAMVGLATSAACELGENGIRVNCISPHGVPSDMLLWSYRKISGNDLMSAREVSEEVAANGSLLQGRSATVDDTAHAALFLASDEGSFITAHNLVVDGGFTSASTSIRFIHHRQFDSE